MAAFLALLLCSVRASAGAIPFTDEATARGINYSAQYLPPIEVGHAGGSQGACFADLDLDGDPDLILVGSPDGSVGVFENDGAGYFTQRQDTGMPLLQKASSATAADYDADGDLDVFLAQMIYPATQGISHYLMRNDGDFQFTNVTFSAGILGGGSTTGTTWGDFNGDGYLDLYVGNYSWSGAPTNNRLYRNLGNRRFVEVAAALGVQNPGGLAFQPSFVDFDLDGDVDLHVVNDRGPVAGIPDNCLWENVGGVSPLVDISASSGAELAMFSMGLTTGDLDRNGWPDFYISNILPNRLLMNNGDQTFTESASVYGVEMNSVSWGVMFFDMDNDGWLDIWVCNTPLGGVGSPAMGLFEFDGTPPAQNVAATMGLDMENSSYGVTSADIDDDGDLDVAVVRPFDPVMLYINHSDEAFPARTWLKVRLVGAAPNIHAVGATVFVDDEIGRQQRSVIVGDGYKSQREMVLHFGTASASTVDVEVRWPGGKSTILQDVSTNQTLVVNQIDEPPCQPPAPASSPMPAAGAVAIAADTSLGWTGVPDATYELYFGDANPPPFLAATTATNHALPLLEVETTYFWRVDTVGCATTVGPTWSFTTIPDIQPQILITSPTSNPSYTTIAASIILAGTAVDDELITGIVWASERGASGPCTTSDNWATWLSGDIPLEPGLNVITVTLTNTLDETASTGLVVDYQTDIPAPQMSFVEVTQQAGLQQLISHPPNPSASNSWIGTGAAVADFDGDGDLDIYFVDALGWPNKLMRNNLIPNGTKTFSQVAENAGLGDTGGGRMALWLDLDNDGDPDLVLLNDTHGGATTAPARIFRNDAATFTDVTAGSGFTPTGTYAGGIAATDYNADGLPDIYVTYWNNATTPLPYNYFYRNTGNFTFIEESQALGLRLANTQKQTWSPVFFDFDGDGDQDLYGAVDFALDYLFFLGPTGYVDMSAPAKVFHEGACPSCPEANDMGVAVGDVDGDGDSDVFTTNIAQPLDGTGKRNALFMNHWPQPCTDEAEAAERNVWQSYWGWGAVLADLDFDRDLDLVTVGGRTAGAGTGDYADKPKQIYKNDGTGHFQDVAAQVGFNHTGNSRALIAFDYDNDGDEDLLITNANTQASHVPLQTTALFENITPQTLHYLKLRLVGTARTREAIGAKVRITAGGQTQYRELMAGGSFLSSLPREMIFGLGSASLIDTIEVTWPCGALTTVNGVPADQTLVIVEDSLEQVTSLIVAGPASVAENTTALFSAIGDFACGPTGPVTDVTWSVQPEGLATIDAQGMLTVGEIPAMQFIDVIATRGAVTATQQVQLNDVVVPDETPPVVVILLPTTEPSLTTEQPILQVAGVAGDDVGLVSVNILLNGATPIACSGLAEWSSGIITLNEGSNEIAVTASDAAGNTASAALNVTYSPPPPPPPIVDVLILASSNHQVDFGAGEIDEKIFVWNAGVGTFDYVIEPTEDWCSVSPADGKVQPLPTSNMHTIHVDRSSFAPGQQREAVLRIRASNVDAAELLVAVYASVPPSEPSTPEPELTPPAIDDDQNKLAACGAGNGCGAVGTASILCGTMTLFGLSRRRRRETGK